MTGSFQAGPLSAEDSGETMLTPAGVALLVFGVVLFFGLLLFAFLLCYYRAALVSARKTNVPPVVLFQIPTAKEVIRAAANRYGNCQ